MKKPKYLLRDANIVIKVYELGLWEKVVDQCDILLSKLLVDESRYFEDEDGQCFPIDLTADITAHRIRTFDLSASELSQFRARFNPTYFEKLDPGESESLAYMFNSSDPCRICSSDGIVFRVLAQFQRGEDGLSLEEVLNQTGLGRKLKYQYTKAFREEKTRLGAEENIRRFGLNRNPD